MHFSKFIRTCACMMIISKTALNAFSGACGCFALRLQAYSRLLQALLLSPQFKLALLLLAAFMHRGESSALLESYTQQALTFKHCQCPEWLCTVIKSYLSSGLGYNKLVLLTGQTTLPSATFSCVSHVTGHLPPGAGVQ